jgi:ribosomal protein S18 acetylase RimI-like enzyme
MKRSAPAQYSRRTKRSRVNSIHSEEEEETTATPPTSQETSLETSQELTHKKKSIVNKKAEQMVLDLGQRLQVDCKECGMSYQCSDADDCAMHEKHHLRLTRGVEWSGKRLLEQSRVLAKVELKLSVGPVTLLAYDWSTSSSTNHKLDTFTTLKLQEIQKVMDMALGSNPFPDHLQRQTKIYLASSKGRILGTLIAGNTPKGKARRVEYSSSTAASEGNEDSPTMSGDYLSFDATPPLAIYRIHVLPFARRTGLASALLDAALNDCVYGMTGKSLIQQYKGKANTIAFSQPTQLGRQLALSWSREGNQTNSALVVFDEATQEDDLDAT